MPRKANDMTTRVPLVLRTITKSEAELINDLGVIDENGGILISDNEWHHLESSSNSTQSKSKHKKGNSTKGYLF